MRRALSWAAVFLLPVVVVGGMYALGRDVRVRNREWPTQMQYSPAARAQGQSAFLPGGMTEQPPVAGTIPRGFRPFHYGTGQEESDRAGRELVNPFEPTAENLARGEYVFTNNCAVCHGQGGAGDGPVAGKYPNPPSYNTEKSTRTPDGALFHVITAGRNNMPPHAAQVSWDDRWKAILYIRKLQGKFE
jgi:mono/diheme cytochrome c family protein